MKWNNKGNYHYYQSEAGTILGWVCPTEIRDTDSDSQSAYTAGRRKEEEQYFDTIYEAKEWVEETAQDSRYKYAKPVKDDNDI